MTTKYKFKPTHHGRFLGVPVWLDMTDENVPGIEPKYKPIGSIALSVMEFLFGCFTWLQTFIDPYYEPMFPILVGKEIEKKS